MKIFLDLDGTLLNVKHKCYMVYSNTLSYGGFHTIPISTYWKMKRNKVSEREIVLRTTTTIFAKYYEEKFKFLIETMDYLVLDSVYDKVYKVLNKLFYTHDLYLVTSRHNKPNLDRQLLYFDLHKYFKHIYSAGETEIKKADLIKNEIVDTSNCIIIGDTEEDIETGKLLGIRTAAVTSGVREKRLLKRKYPDILVKNIYSSKLSNWLEKNSKGV